LSKYFYFYKNFNKWNGFWNAFSYQGCFDSNSL